VAHAQDWPGVHSVREILAGEPIQGYWWDRTQYAARNRGEIFGRMKYSLFVAAFREASERLRAGDRMARFPLGSFR
jgi:hypothetical protein